MHIVKLLLFFIVVPTTLFTQPFFSEQDCIAYALENNPTLKVARLKVLKQEKLKNTAIDIPSTEVSYSYGNINSSYIDYTWQVSQPFEFPTVYASKLKQQKNYIELEKINYVALENELIKEVKLYYNDLSYYNEKITTIYRLDSLYDYFESRSREKFEKDTVHLLENIALISKHKSVDLLINDTEKDYDIVKAKLQQLLYMEQDFHIQDTVLKRLKPDTSITLEHNPYLKFRDQEIVTAQQNTRIQSSRHLPELVVGYFNQQIDLHQGYDGFVVGANIPLWAGANRGQVQAAMVEEEIYEERYEILKINLERQYKVLIETFDKNKYIVDYYDKEGLSLMQTLYTVSSSKYNNNIIDYVEYLNNMEQAIDMYIQYITALHDYNDAIIQMHYLTGK